MFVKLCCSQCEEEKTFTSPNGRELMKEVAKSGWKFGRSLESTCPDCVRVSSCQEKEEKEDEQT